MKIDFSKPILDLDDKETGLTLGSVAAQALMTPGRGDEGMEGQEKMRLYDLWLKIKTAGSEDFPVEDIAFLKARIGKMCPQLVVGRAFEMLG